MFVPGPVVSEMSTAPAGTIAVTLIDASAFSRSCTLAGLEEAAGLVVRAAATVATAPPERPDLVLVQHHAGDPLDLLTAELRAARRTWPGATLAVLADAAAAVALTALRSGARLVLPGDVGLDSVISAIRLADASLAVVPVAALTMLEQPDTGVESGEGHVAPLGAEQLGLLTPRQRDVIGVLATGLSNKAIARRLGISESTVKVHIRAIMAATGVSNRTQLVARFLAG